MKRVQGEVFIRWREDGVARSISLPKADMLLRLRESKRKGDPLKREPEAVVEYRQLEIVVDDPPAGVQL